MATKRPETPQEEARRGNRMVEMLYGDVRREKGLPVPVSLEGPEQRQKRVIVNHSPSYMLERSVVAETILMLRKHPDVVMAIRQNGGAMDAELEGGEKGKVYFYRWIKGGKGMLITDFWGWLRLGNGFIPWALECKRRDWGWKGTKRELWQRKFINAVKRLGGRAGFATSSLEAQNILEGK